MRATTNDTTLDTRALLGVAVALLSLGPTEIAAQDAVYELRCRGGENLFVLDGPEATGSDTLHLNFGWSFEAAGADGAGLDPGSCAWIDRGYRDGEPSQIHFTTAGPAADVSASLNDSTRQWRFWVLNTGRGHFEARRNEPVTSAPYVERPRDLPVEAQWDRPVADAVIVPDTGPARPPVVERTEPTGGVVDIDPVGKAGARSRPDVETGNLTVTIHDVTVRPIPEGVKVCFRAARGTSPWLTIRADERIVARLRAGPPTRVTAGGADFRIVYSRLEPDTEYAYVITVPRPGGALTKAGSFTTRGHWDRTVEIDPLRRSWC